MVFKSAKQTNLWTQFHIGHHRHRMRCSSRRVGLSQPRQVRLQESPCWRTGGRHACRILKNICNHGQENNNHSSSSRGGKHAFYRHARQGFRWNGSRYHNSYNQAREKYRTLRGNYPPASWTTEMISVWGSEWDEISKTLSEYVSLMNKIDKK